MGNSPVVYDESVLKSAMRKQGEIEVIFNGYNTGFMALGFPGEPGIHVWTFSI